MNSIVAINTAGLLATTVAFYVIYTCRCSVLKTGTQRMLLGLILFTLLSHGTSIIEWFEILPEYDDYSDFSRLLLPLFWFFFLYTYHQDNIYTRQLDSERKYRSLIEQSLAGIYIIQDNRFVFTNRKFQEIFGYTDEEIKGLPSILELVYEDDRKKVADNLAKRLSGKLKTIQYSFRGLRKDRSVIYVEVHGSTTEWNERSAAMGILVDITETRSLMDQLSYQESHDRLTGLINRQECERRVAQLLKNSYVDKSSHVLCKLNIDQFKVINDTCGSIAGDTLLEDIAVLLKKGLRRADILARIGGDEFGIVLTDCSVPDAEMIALDLLKIIRNYRFEWEGKKYAISVRIGMAPFNETLMDSSQVFSRADIACNAARQKSGNHIHTYLEEDKESRQTQEDMLMAGRLNEALDNNRFVLYWQPIFPINDITHKSHYEVLIRMLNEKGATIAPGEFLPPAEKYGLSPRIDQWVINRLFSFFRENPGKIQDINMCAVNLSGQSIGNGDLLKNIIFNIREKLIPADRICFEITETAAVTNLYDATKFIKTLKQYGCKFSLDDFGTGMSSFSYLKSLPVDYLKIDGSFVRNIHSNQIDLAIVKSINEIGHVMGKKTIAEFVENKEILSRLSDIGVDYAQGYGLGRPEPIERG